MLASGTLMLVAGITAALIAAARGLGLTHALHIYVWTGLWFACASVALFAVAMIPFWAWRRVRGSRPVADDLPDEYSIVTGRAAWVEAGRAFRINIAFVAVVALAQPRLGAALGGFSLLAVTLLPLWLYQRRNQANEQMFLVRGPGRWKTRMYRRRRTTSRDDVPLPART